MYLQFKMEGYAAPKNISSAELIKLDIVKYLLNQDKCVNHQVKQKTHNLSFTQEMSGHPVLSQVSPSKDEQTSGDSTRIKKVCH